MRPGRWRSLAILAAALSIGWVLWRLPLTLPGESHRSLGVAWILAFAAYAIAFVRWRRWALEDVASWWRRERSTVAAVGALVVIAAVVRLWHLGSVPFIFSGDEAGQGLETLGVLGGTIRNPFATGRLGMPTGTFFFNSATVWLLGPSPFALRLPWALIGTATVVVTYALVARLTRDRTVALAASALLAVYHYHIHYSRLALNNAADPLMAGLALLFLYRAVDEGRRLDWVCAGAVCGLAFYGYPGARLVAGIVGITAVRLVVTRWREEHAPPWRGLAIAGGAFLLIAAPMLQYAIRFPDDFNARVNTVGILQNGWLTREMALRGESAPVILLEHFRHAALVFNSVPASPIHYGWPGPLLDPVTGVFFALGLLWATARVLLPPWDDRLFPMVAWWWLGIVFGGLLTEPPPTSARLLTVVVPVCCFSAVAFRGIVERARQLGVPLRARPALAVAITLFGINSLYGYFVTFTPLRISGGQHAELATELAPTLSTLDPAARVHLLGAPHMFAAFPTLTFFARAVPIGDVNDPLVEPLPGGFVSPGDLFIVMPHRIAELPILAAASPGGDVKEIRSPVDGRLMATLYRARAAGARRP